MLCSPSPGWLQFPPGGILLTRSLNNLLPEPGKLSGDYNQSITWIPRYQTHCENPVVESPPPPWWNYLLGATGSILVYWYWYWYIGTGTGSTGSILPSAFCLPLSPDARGGICGWAFPIDIFQKKVFIPPQSNRMLFYKKANNGLTV